MEAVDCQSTYTLPQAGAAQILDFTVTSTGADLLDGGAAESLLALRRSVRFRVNPERGELTVARNSTLEK
jgi:hypothetical protein